ncbi:hypothetical protein HOLleu_02710 [Holothuria leucospilota]|uniref:Uncharacterized protein n=1 Tax=Holothuria leucospilota TaxID=206669 RepID=A0A9Q1CR27_HOLLE|nr:hypothetical protein HOLleu_02710 [Holothuria leucospilota]
MCFQNLLSSYGLVQHVASPTHQLGHTLDLFITRASDPIVFRNLQCKDGLSNHFAITCNLLIEKPPPLTKSIKTRNLKAINIDSFCNDVSNPTDSSFLNLDLNGKVSHYNSVLSNLLETHAPATVRNVRIRPNTSWYDEIISSEKKKRRKLEKKWRKSRLEIDRQLYKQQKQKVISLIKSAKLNYYKNLCATHSKDQKKLFNIINKLLHKRHEISLPDCESDEELANKFSHFFL